jgi:hypothetical protein
VSNALVEEHGPYPVPPSRPGTRRLHVTAPVPERPDLADARTRREASRSLGLSGLLERRPDLAGVHAPADQADEFLRWCL